MESKRGRPKIHGEDTVFLIFKETSLRKTELRIKLKEDNFSLSKFFQTCITAYLKNDPNILQILGLIENENQPGPVSRSKRIQKIIKKEELGADKIKEDFGLEDTDLDKLYDMIESQGLDV